VEAVSLPVSLELRQEITAFYVQQFGVPESFIDGLAMEANKEEIWGGTGVSLPGIYSPRAVGLRIGRNFPKGFKPTSVFLTALGSLITRSLINVDLDQARQLLLGQRIPFSGTEAGYVALSYRGDILGCGRSHDGRLHALIPTGRRKELLEILCSHS
jgi:NOL1/NOP2/fmu family ribosome biogenesis protein